MPPPLEERFYESNRAQLFRWLPWLHLFRAFRIALDFRKILLGTLAAIALAAGDAAIEALPFAQASVAPSRSPTFYVHDADLHGPGIQLHVDSLPLADAVLNGDRWPRVLRPLQSVIEPGARLFQSGNSWADAAHAWTQLLFRLAVWSLLGGAIARIAAVQFAHRESVTARAAVRYSAARFGSIIGAPLLPLVFIGFFWIIYLALGLVGRIPGAGPAIVGGLWFLPLLIGIALAVILLVIAVSWPLMVATVSVEGSDAFDGLSRGYDYVLNRTWYALWLVVLKVVYGTIVVAFVYAVANYAAHLAHWGVGSGMGERNLREMLPAAAPLGLSAPTGVTSQSLPMFGGIAAVFWLRGFAWLLQGFLISYFWTAVTIIYFLLRLSLDAKPLDDVYIPAPPDTDEALPLVGMPASERRAAASGDSGAPQPPA